MGLTLILAIPTPDVSIYLHHEEQTMQHMKLKLAAAITAALLSTNVLADSWAVTQETTPGAAAGTTMLQNGASGSVTTGSVQAMNVVNSTTATVTGTQDADMTAGDLTLDQAGATTNSTQAANYAKSLKIGDSTAFTQSHKGAKAITLNQADVASGGSAPAASVGPLGSGNLQAVNTAHAVGTGSDLKSLTQNVTQAVSVKLNQTAGTANTQAVNNAETAEGSTSVTQNATPTGTDADLTLTQSGAGNKVQAANRMMGGTTKVGTVVQSAGTNAKDTKMKQDGSGKNTQAMNMAVVQGVTTKVEQAVVGKVEMKQGETSTPGNGSLQAGNYFKSTGSAEVTLAKQKMGNASVTDGITLKQTKGDGDATDGVTSQIGNLVDMSASTGALTKATQEMVSGATITLEQSGAVATATQAGNAVRLGGTGAQTVGDVTTPQTVSAVTLDMDQNATTGKAIQAGNLIESASDSGALTGHQKIDVSGTWSMDQIGTSGGLQAGNAVVTDSTGSGGGTITQKNASGSLVMKQTTATNSYQAANYIGKKL